MGFIDKIKGVLGQNSDKADQAIDKAAEFADDKTGGKHTDKIETASEKAKDVVDKVAGDEAK